MTNSDTVLDNNSYELLPSAENDSSLPSTSTMGTDRSEARRGDKISQWIALVSRFKSAFYLFQLTELRQDCSSGKQNICEAPKVFCGSNETRYQVLMGTAWSVILLNDPTSKGWFAFHPLLVTLALALATYGMSFRAQIIPVNRDSLSFGHSGIMTLQPTKTAPSKAAGLERHTQAMAYSSVPLLLLGISAVWYNKELRAAEHFTTLHGQLGSLCFLIVLLQAFLGGGSVWFGGRLFGGGVKAKSVWKYHRILGYILFTLMLITTHLGGAWSGWATRNTAVWTRVFAFTAAPLAIAVGILGRIRCALLSRLTFVTCMNSRLDSPKCLSFKSMYIPGKYRTV